MAAAGKQQERRGRARSAPWYETRQAFGSMELRKGRRFDTMRIELVQGDITAQDVAAIVNAANSSLMGGGGVDGAIHRRGGPEILEECKRIRTDHHPDGLPTGQAVATTGGRRPARWVIHTVGPVFSKSEDRSRLLASCHTESLRGADELGARTVAFPAISTGVYGYPLDEAAPLALGAVLDGSTSVAEVRFVLFDEAAHEAVQRALRARQAGPSLTGSSIPL